MSEPDTTTENWTLRHPTEGNERTFDTKEDALQEMNDLEKFFDRPLELVDPDGDVIIDSDTDETEHTTEDTGVENDDEPEPKPAEPDIVDTDTVLNEVQEPPTSDVAQDPITWMPDHFIDEIQGVPAINRKGYAVLAEHYEITVRSDPVTLPSETDWEYAEFKATAVTANGNEYSGFGSAHVNRDDDAMLLGELAETRAMKRATAWATGVGMTAVEELQGGGNE